MSDKDTLYLIDGSGFIYRAYFAIRAPMSAADGTPTNAVYGFMRLLINVLRDREPAHVAVIFDKSSKTFRNEIYPEYKANRAAPPDDLRPQFQLCRDATQALALPALDLDNFEADDIIGTFAKQWTVDPNRKCVIVTADKDMMQLVNPQISLWDGKEKETEREQVIEKFGVPPERVIDVLALAGDTSDNIPGVPGIGVKTAAKLLGTYDDLNAILAAAPTIKGKRGANLIEFADNARLSRTLATIDCEAPIELDEEGLIRTPPDPTTLTKFLRSLNFKKFLKEFGLEGHATAQLDRSTYRSVLDEAHLAKVIKEIRAANTLSFDLETTSLSVYEAQIVGFALAWSPGKAVYVPVAHDYPNMPEQLPLDTVLAQLGPLLTDHTLPKFGHHLKYDWQVLYRNTGLELVGIECDSLIASFLLDANRLDFKLDDLAADHLGHRMISFREVTGTKGTEAHFAHVPIETATTYAAEDADVTLRLCKMLIPRLEAEGLSDLADTIELPLIPVLARMELRGIRILPEVLLQQAKEHEPTIKALEVQIYALAGEEFNINSPVQLRKILFDKLDLPTDGNKERSTAERVMRRLAPHHPLPAKILEYRQLVKLRGTYLEKLPNEINPETKRLHTSFRQTGAATGRLASRNPNLQNIPIRRPEGRRVREAFVAQPGWKLLSADYSQVELRLIAHFANEATLIEAFANGEDIHRRTAAEVFNLPEGLVTPELRSQAKAVNYGLSYGMQANRLAMDQNITKKEAQLLIDRYFARYPGVKQYFNDALDKARETMKSHTLFGRVRPLPLIRSRSFWNRSQAERFAVNSPIQGTAADILKIAMINLERRLNTEPLEARLLLTVHDELIVEVPEAEVELVIEIVREEMEGAASLRVPLKVDIGVGHSWAEIH